MSDNQYYNKNLKSFAAKKRRESTRAEIRLWSKVLRGGRMHGYTFNRQRPVLNYIADFMCKELKLIIEVDGFSHEHEKSFKRDIKRQAELEKNGFTILHFTEEQVFKDLRNVEEQIAGWIEQNN